MEKYLRINSLAIAKGTGTSTTPDTNNELKGAAGTDFTAMGVEAGDFVLTSTGRDNGPAYALDKVVSVTDADELILNTSSTFAIPTDNQFTVYDKDTRRDTIIRCSDIASIVQVGGPREFQAGSPIVCLVYNGIEIQYASGAMLTIVFEGNDPSEAKAGAFYDALINQIETHLQSNSTKVMADFVIPPGSEEFVAIQRGSASVVVS